MLSRRQLALPTLLVVLQCASAWAAFQSAVITLNFPPGARATGLGEAFTGLADDANATFYNPAGLGQAPLANSWKTYLADHKKPFYAIATKRKTDFALKEKIWVGTADGILRYNGKAWEAYETHPIQENESLTEIAGKYVASEDAAAVRAAVQKLRILNKIEVNRYEALSRLVKVRPDSGAAEDTVDLAAKILDLSSLDRDSSSILELMATRFDSTKAVALTSKALNILATVKDRSFDKLVDIRIPFSLATSDSITALVVDESEVLWAGTPHGLWKLDGGSWTRYTALDGLPSDFVTCIATGPKGEIAVGTDLGFAVYAEAAWKSDDLSRAKFPDARVTAIAFGAENTTLYVGTLYGLVQKKGDAWTIYDTTQGLASSEVTALMRDADNQLWVGGHNGLAVYDQAAWKRYRFPESVVNCIAEYARGRVWIGTNRGVVVYSPGRSTTDAAGKTVQMPPEWKAFHSKNALKGDQVYAIAVHGKDVWLTTDKAINRLDNAEKQVLLFFEYLLPALKLPDLYHSYLSFVYPTDDWGTLALSVNFISFGNNEATNEEGVVTDRFFSWEGVFGLSYGLGIKQDFSFGLSVKYVVSALAPTGDGTGVGQTFAVDAALLKRNLFIRGLDLGFMLQNMGPPIFYVSRADADPLPFIPRLGLAYRAVETPVHDLTLLLDVYRELAGKQYGKEIKGFWDGIYYDLKRDPTNPEEATTSGKIKTEAQEIQLNTGLEYWYVNFLALRSGFLLDWIGERYELTLGLGIKYGNLNVDFSYIHSPEGFMKGLGRALEKDPTDSHREGSHGVRHGQPRFSLIVRF
jgi:ligand-binding sensor domain-containing protein